MGMAFPTKYTCSCTDVNGNESSHEMYNKLDYGNIDFSPSRSNQKRHVRIPNSLQNFKTPIIVEIVSSLQSCWELFLEMCEWLIFVRSFSQTARNLLGIFSFSWEFQEFQELFWNFRNLKKVV
jgi:hypothetical protein